MFTVPLAPPEEYIRNVPSWIGEPRPVSWERFRLPATGVPSSHVRVADRLSTHGVRDTLPVWYVILSISIVRFHGYFTVIVDAAFVKPVSSVWKVVCVECAKVSPASV